MTWRNLLSTLADIQRCRHTVAMTTIYMPLLNEGIDVWRPVQATPLTAEVYRVEGSIPEDEHWAFVPGTLVRCEWRKFSSGEERLTAVALAE